jgi:acyl-CoA thioesterase
VMKDGEQQPAAIDVFTLAARDNFARSLGIEIVEAALGRAVSRVRLEERHINFIGVAHGGLVFTLADAAMGYATLRASSRPASIPISSTACRPARAMS